jgi:hypothetical protein
MVDIVHVMNERFSGLFELWQAEPLTRVRIGDVTVQHHSGTGNIILSSCSIARDRHSCAIAEKFGIHIATGPRGTHFSTKLHAGRATEDELVTHMLKVQRASASFKTFQKAHARAELA